MELGMRHGWTARCLRNSPGCIQTKDLGRNHLEKIKSLHRQKKEQAKPDMAGRTEGIQAKGVDKGGCFPSHFPPVEPPEQMLWDSSGLGFKWAGRGPTAGFNQWARPHPAHSGRFCGVDGRAEHPFLSRLRGSLGLTPLERCRARGLRVATCFRSL